MKDIMIYHPQSENYLCVNTPEITLWDYDPVSAGKLTAGNRLTGIWCYSAREDKQYGSYSSQGLHHKKTGAVLGIAGTGEQSGNVIAFSNHQTCHDLTLTIEECPGGGCHIIWSRAGLYLNYEQEGDKLLWEKYPLAEQSVFRITNYNN